MLGSKEIFGPLAVTVTILVQQTHFALQNFVKGVTLHYTKMTFFMKLI